MNIKLTIWIVGIFLGAVVVGVVWYVMFIPKNAPQTTPQQPTTTLPTSGSIIYPSAASSQTTKTMDLTTQNGSIVVANDFIHNGMTILDKMNTGRYMLAGNLGYCLSDQQQCQAASSTNFNVYYNSAPQSFTIALTNEPIGQARLAMEQFMLITLGLTEQQMCSLNYYVGTTRYVNAAYANGNLGFSFCPGATKLPN